METLTYYVLPNIALFGGIFLLGKGIEYAAWYIITNYETLMERFK